MTVTKYSDLCSTWSCLFKLMLAFVMSFFSATTKFQMRCHCFGEINVNVCKWQCIGTYVTTETYQSTLSWVYYIHGKIYNSRLTALLV